MGREKHTLTDVASGSKVRRKVKENIGIEKPGPCTLVKFCLTEKIILVFRIQQKLKHIFLSF